MNSQPITFPFSDTEDSDAESPQRQQQKYNTNQTGCVTEDDLDEDGDGENAKLQANGEVEIERPIFSSYLKKKGEQRRNWKKRWFVLRATKLSYYKDDKEYEILNIIPLAKIHAVSSIQLKRKNVFGIVTKQRTYYLQARDESEMNGWIEHIRAALLKAFPNGDDRGILSPSLFATTSPRISQAIAPDTIPLSPLTLPPGNNFNITATSRQHPQPGSLITAQSINTTDKSPSFRESGVSAQSPDFISPSTAAPQPAAISINSAPIPLLKPLNTAQPSLANPSPLSKSWVDNDDGGLASDSDDEDIASSPVHQTLPDALKATEPDDKFKPQLLYSVSADCTPSLDTPLIQGYLYKLKTNMGGVKIWKKYWFVIRNEKLTSYKNEREYEVKRIILLPDVIAALSIDAGHGKEFIFKVVLAKKNFVFATKDLQSKLDWIKMIQDCISHYQGKVPATSSVP